MKPASTTSIMRVPPWPQAAAGYDGARLSRTGVAAGEVHA